MCVNGVRRSGYMFDSLASVMDNGLWLYYMKEIERSNVIYNNQFTNMLSCFGAMAFYSFPDIIQSGCRYMTTDIALSHFPELQQFSYINKRKGDKGLCEHISFNYCLYKNNYKLAIARDAYLYYGFFH